MPVSVPSILQKKNSNGTSSTVSPVTGTNLNTSGLISKAEGKHHDLLLEETSIPNSKKQSTQEISVVDEYDPIKQLNENNGETTIYDNICLP